MCNNRQQQKEKTRRNIIDSALKLLSQERNYASLSLREVTRTAGIAPMSFYRHFEDMEELGLVLVDEAGVSLRQLMRKARQRIKKKGSVIATSVETFMEFISDNPDIFRLLLRERTGMSAAFRKAVSREIQFFVVELADYIQQVEAYPETEARIQAEAMVLLVFNAGAEALDCNRNERKRLEQKAIIQLRFVAKGADVFLRNSHK